jgi:predicted ferric reductase
MMKVKIGTILIWSFLSVTLILFLWAKLSGGSGIVFSWLFVSQLFSLLGATLLALSFVLSSRWRFIEAWFGGMDKMYHYHHLLGGLAFVLLLHHPLFLILEALPAIGIAWRYLWLSNMLPYNWGILSLYSMALMLIFTLLVSLPYSLWQKTHEFMGLALLFATLHILTITSDVSRFIPLRLWIVFLLLLAASAVIYRRFLYGLFGPRYQYLVKKTRRLGDIYTIDLVPTAKKLFFRPGQFVFARFSGMGSEIHPFSLASGPHEDFIRIIIKVLGDYTWRLDSLEPGSPATLWGSYGTFGDGAFGDHDLIWIAGGIGITPFLSLLIDETQNTKSRQIDIFYCVSSETEAVFDQEIKRLSAQKPGLTYHLHPTNVCGRLDVGRLTKLCGGLSNKKIMLCGPGDMMNSLTSQLSSAGVKNQNIYFEDFNFK